MAHKKEVVQLYRRILKLAQQYPSVKRDAIIQDIKLEFHENKLITDAPLIEQKLAAAYQGLKELSMYADLNPKSMNWSVAVARDTAQGKPSGDPSVKVVGDKS